MDPRRRAFLRGHHVPAASGGHVALIGPACLARRRVECRVCGEACDAGAIRFRPTLGGVPQPTVDIARCTGCGDCASRCLAGAIVLGPPEPGAAT